MCEARFARLSIAKPGAISPPPSSRQGRRLPLASGNAVIWLCSYAGAAAFEPQLANGWLVGWQHRYPEAAVAIDMDRRVAGLAGRSHLHIGDGRAVRRHGFMSSSDEPGRVECLGCALEQLWRGTGVNKIQRWRGERILGGREQITVRFLGMYINRPDMSGAKIRQAGDDLPRPFSVGRRDHLEYRSQIIEDRQHQRAAAPKKSLESAPVTWLK